MAIKNKIPALIMLSSCLAAGNTLAAVVAGNPIYQTTGRFIDSVQVTDGFVIDSQGLYQATLTDFKSARAFNSSGLDISDGKDSLGSMAGPGSFTFSAGPGAYNVSMFAEVGQSQMSVEEKQQLIDEEHQRRREINAALWNSLTKEQKWARKEQRKDIWRSMSKAEREEKQARKEIARNKWLENQLAAMNTGQYGIEISRLEGTDVSAVPLPAAAWLFGSGMLALAGLGRRKTKR